MLSNCSRAYCAYQQPVGGPLGTTCVCNASYTGAHCETRKCGMYGDATGPGGACECFGVMRLNAATGVCTNHICGRADRGYPVAGTWCTCLNGSRLVQTDSVCQCQRPCHTLYGTYDPATDLCVCVPGYTGDLCQLVIVSKQTVRRDLNVIVAGVLVAFIALVTSVAMLAPHLRTNVFHTAAAKKQQ